MNQGNKAKNLTILKDAGFNVPTFIVINNESGDTKKYLNKFIKPNKLYAVRSSGNLEDLPGLSFAGQYYTALNIKGVNNVLKEIDKCYDSIKSATVKSYLKNNNLSEEGLKMSVIIQEMVDADYSGVAFSINPLSGDDKEIVVNIAKGLGDAVVSGHITPTEYSYNWFNDSVTKNSDLISDKLLQKIVKTVLDIQVLFGFPVDVEFAIKDDKMYLLQSRAITKILYQSIDDQWTTADFKDGGVSSSVCTPFMWSLYEYIWEISYRNYLEKDLALSGKVGGGKLGEMFYGRPYWNLSKAKMAMAMVPGYKERQFDNDLGIKPAYKGDGVVTKLSLKSMIRGLKIMNRSKNQVNRRLSENLKLQAELLDTYNNYFSSVNDKDQDWHKLVFESYLKSESFYFEQIFINTVAQSIFRDKLLKHVSKEDFLRLLSGLSDVSHLRPYLAIWKLSRKDKITNKDIDKFVEEFGYHSDKELDVTYPHYAEDKEKIRRLIKETSKLSESANPDIISAGQVQSYEKVFNKLPKKLKTITKQMRTLLWWREEFRDISTKYYYLIRLFTLKLASKYTSQKIIDSPEDIWFLKIKDISDYMNGLISSEEIKKIVERNRTYYQSFRNFTPENEIGKSFNNSFSSNEASKSDLSGIGCSDNTVTGRARIIKGLDEIHKIEPGDILVTKFTDTGWTSKFAILNGVVTEYGGVLCHAAIVSREFGIPCVVGVEGATQSIKDGDTITINGSSGEIFKEE